MLWNKLTDKSDDLLKYLTESHTEKLSDEQMQKLLEQLQSPAYLKEKQRQQQRFDYRPAFRKVVGGKRRLWMNRMRRIAAVLVLPVCLSVVAYYFLSEFSSSMKPSENRIAEVKPGEKKAILQLADGKQVELSGMMKEMQEVNGTSIVMDSAGLRYENQEGLFEEKEILNYIRIPRGGEFHLTLSDGTKVWLNAASELKYPVSFGQEKREVMLVGEGYFEVTRDTTRPFVVKTEVGDIRVLGTAFNVQAYREEGNLIATLVHGAVRCSSLDGTSAVVLRPDEQVILEKNGIRQVRTVNTRLYTGWKDGLFIFENERLEEILKQLARWYDVEIFYTDMKLKELHFSGDLSRFKEIDVFLRMFERSADIMFSLKGRTLTVNRK